MFLFFSEFYSWKYAALFMHFWLVDCIDRYVDLLLGEFKHYKTRLAHGGIRKEVLLLLIILRDSYQVHTNKLIKWIDLYLKRRLLYCWIE